jgi:hypothetical protein
MIEPQKICSVDLGKMLDNEYTLYEDGQVKRYYDRRIYDTSHVDWFAAHSLTDDVKQKLLGACPQELRDKANSLLYP